MIVQCEQCQTRFKIPDEKVTEKGVKVRCTKCQNTFRVAREPAPDLRAPLPVPAPAEQADPFQAFGAAPEPTGEVTRPGSAYYAPGGPGAPGARPSPARSWGEVDVDIDVDDAQAAPVRAPASQGARGPLTPFDAPTASPGIAARRQVAPAPAPPPVNLSGLNEEDPFADFMSDAGPLPAPASAPPVALPTSRPVAATGPGVPPRPSVTGMRSVPPGAFAPPAPRAAPPGAFAAGPPGALRPGASPSPSAPSPFQAGPSAPPPGLGAFGASSAPLEFDDSLGDPSAHASGPGAFASGPSARSTGPGAFPGASDAFGAGASAQPSGLGARAGASPQPPGPGAGASAQPSGAGARAGASAQPRSGPAPTGRPAPVAAAAADPLFDFSLDDAPAAAPPAANTVVTGAPHGARAPSPALAAPAPSFESEDPFASIDLSLIPI
ncbi:zinc-ribbon domain-containing protein, partial [Corallococcus praedator]|uniref:zinc-ribbon domain-containing protein n=1 Tax=Corallococcus praedator TaxID=2316724 RepID=UPI001ABF5C58